MAITSKQLEQALDQAMKASDMDRDEKLRMVIAQALVALVARIEGYTELKARKLR